MQQIDAGSYTTQQTVTVRCQSSLTGRQRFLHNFRMENVQAIVSDQASLQKVQLAQSERRTEGLT